MATSSTAIAQHTLLGRSDDFDSRFLTAQAAVVVLRGLTGGQHPGAQLLFLFFYLIPPAVPLGFDGVVVRDVFHPLKHFFLLSNRA